MLGCSSPKYWQIGENTFHNDLILLGCYMGCPEPASTGNTNDIHNDNKERRTFVTAFALRQYTAPKNEVSKSRRSKLLFEVGKTRETDMSENIITRC